MTGTFTPVGMYYFEELCVPPILQIFAFLQSASDAWYVVPPLQLKFVRHADSAEVVTIKVRLHGGNLPPLSFPT
jgi:hypothetical protein